MIDETISHYRVLEKVGGGGGLTLLLRSIGGLGKKATGDGKRELNWSH